MTLRRRGLTPFGSSLSRGCCHTRRITNRNNRYPGSWGRTNFKTQSHCKKATLGGSFGFGFRYMF